MQQFDSVSAPASDPAALVAALNARSALGWSVVSIVANGGTATAFLSREGGTTNTEPSGWAVAPTSVAPTQVVQQVMQPTPQPAAATSYQPTTQSVAPPVSTAVPANWYADPSGRYELRYWDGSQWTEHVSRGGQQFTDPPVA